MSSTTRWPARRIHVLLAVVLALSLVMVMGPIVSVAQAQEPEIWYVSTGGNDSTGNGTAVEPFATIQYAVNMAAAGDTISVAPGTYRENITIAKALTLQGQTGAIVDGSSNATSGYAGSCIIVEANQVVIDGFEITGGANGIVGVTSNSTIKNNKIHDNRNYMGSNGAGIDLWGDNDNNEILDNEIYDNDRQGIFIGYENSTKISSGNVISGNTIYGNGLYVLKNGPDASSYGIQLWNADNNTIEDNEIYGHEDFLVTPTYDFAQGIYLCASFNNTVEHNYLHANNYGLGFWAAGRTIPSDEGTKVSLNDITGNTGYGVRNVESTFTLDAAFNWWGQISGPAHASNPGGTGDAVSSNVMYSPWLGDPGDTRPMTFIVDDVGPEPAAGYIQAAVDGAGTGDTIEVAAGEYDEQVVINKGLTLQGAGDTTIIKPSQTTADGFQLFSRKAGGASNTAPIIIGTDATTGVTVKSLKVDGSSVSSVPSGADNFVGILYRGVGGVIDSASVTGIRVTQKGSSILLSSMDHTVTAEVKDCTVTNFLKGGITADYAGLTVSIHDNVVTGSGPSAASCPNAIEIAYGATGMVADNVVSNVAYTGTGYWWSYGIIFGDATGTATGNTLTNCQAGIGAEAPFAGSHQVTISGNTICAPALEGVPNVLGVYLCTWNAGASIDATITDNDLSAGEPGRGIQVGDTADRIPAGTVDATIEGNDVSSWSDGIWLGLSSHEVSIVHNDISDNKTPGPGSGIHILSGVDVSTIYVNRNRIVGNIPYDVYSDATGTLDATLNWWGQASGPDAGQVEGGAETTPWIADYTVESGHAAGFWPTEASIVRGFPADEPAAVPTGEDVSQAFFGEDGEPLGAVTFDDVTVAGVVTIEVVEQGDSDYVAPAGFALGHPAVYFDIRTTAEFTGKIKVCLNYDPESFSGATPSLFHYEAGQWVDVTKGVDTTNHIVCGEVSSLSPFAVGLENVRPTVTINQAGSQADPTNASPIYFTATFNEPVTGFTSADVTLSGTARATTATVTAVTGSGITAGTTYTIAVSGMTRDGTVIATIPAGVAKDAAGNLSRASTSTDNQVTYDITAPTVTINQAAGQADPTGSSPIYFTVVFGEPVSGFTSADVILSGTAGATTALVGGSGTTYTVAVSGMTKDGTVIASIESGAAQDAAGNASLVSTSTDNVVTYSTTRPAVTINQATGQADPTSSSPISFTAIFSEPVTGFSSTDVTLSGTAGATTATVTAVSGSGITPGTTYSVAVSGMTKDGTVIASIAAGAAQDAAGNWNLASTSTDNVVTYQTRDLWTDITNSQWLAWYGVSAVQIAGVAQGYPEDGSFRPAQPIIRAQFAKMVVDGYDLSLATPATPTFSDVGTGHYYFSWIEGAVAAGIISGYEDHTFRPETEISREQTNSILGRYLSQKELEATGHIQGARATYASLATWYAAEGQAVLAPFADKGSLSAVHAPYTAYLIYQEVVLGTTGADGSRYLDPLAKITRAQAAVLIVRTSEMTF